MRIDFLAPVVVTDENDDPIEDEAIVSSLVGVVFPDIALTEHFGGLPEETPIAVHLDPGGSIELFREEPGGPLHALTTYRSTRRLSDSKMAVELAELRGENALLRVLKDHPIG